MTLLPKQRGFMVGAKRVRGSVVAILILIIVLSVWTVIGYITWVNDYDPSGVLPRLAAAESAQSADPSEAVPAVAPERVIIYVVDGLRADTSRQMESLRILAEDGAELYMDVGLPSQSRPVYAVLSSGVWQGRSGIRLNSYHGPATVDSIWQRTREAGFRVNAVSTLSWWEELFPHGFDRYLTITPERFADAARLALEAPVDLLLLHATHVDYAGHQYGGRSDEVRLQAERQDNLISQLLQTHIDLRRDVLWVLADHGHRDRGGHGGDEPSVRIVRTVVAGLGIADHVEADIGVNQVGPTISVLLGVPFPHDASGQPLFELFDRAVLGETYLELRRGDWERHISSYLHRLSERGPADFEPADGFEGWRGGMDSERQEGRSIRLGIAIVFISVGFFFVAHLRRQALWRVVFAGFSFVFFYVLASWLTENLQSLSAAEREYRYLLRLAAIGLIAFIGQHVVIRLLKVTDWGTAYLLGVWLSGSTIGLTIAYFGIPLTAPMPSAFFTFWPLFATVTTFSQASMGALSLVLLWLYERYAEKRAIKPVDSHSE